MLRHVPPDGLGLLLWGRGFFSFTLWKLLISWQVGVLARVKSNPILRPTKALSDGSYLAKIYPNAYDGEKDRHGIVVRVIRYKLDDPQRVGHDEEHVLVTHYSTRGFIRLSAPDQNGTSRSPRSIGRRDSRNSRPTGTVSKTFGPLASERIEQCCVLPNRYDRPYNPFNQFGRSYHLQATIGV